MLPADLAADPPSLDPVVVRRARVFSAEPPVLRADATGGPITLRRATERDVERMVVACRDPEALKWTSVPDPYHRENAEWYVGFAAEQWAAGAGALFGVYDPSDTYCGSMDLRLSPTDPGGADVGYLMSPDIRGRGYATAALRALCEWGVPALGLQRVEWRAHVGNLASRRVAEKAGFTVEGMLRSGVPHGGGRADCWLGSLLASDLPTPSR